MKKLILSIFLLPFLANAAVEFDLVKGIDFTHTNYMGPSMLNQLVDNGKIAATNKGAIIRFSGGGGARWPNVTDNPRYTNFLWMDINVFPGTLKQYVPSGDVYTNWVVSTVTPGSVTTTEILDYTITDADLATNSVSDFTLKAGSVSGNKIADNGIIAGKLGPASVGKGSIAFGAITGGDITNKTVTATNIADNTITAQQLANDAITTLSLTNGAVTTDKIAETNITRNLIRNDAVGTLQITNAAVTTNKLAGDINSSLLTTNVSYGLAKAYAYVDSSGTLVKGFNIASAVRTAAGRYSLTFGSGFTPSSTNYLVSGSGLNATAGRIMSVTTNTTTVLSVILYTTGGAGDDTPFSVLIHDF